MIVTISCGVLSLGLTRKRTWPWWFRYGVAMAAMLLAALVETWMAAFWQPDLYRLDLEWQHTAAGLFAFPLKVLVVRGSWFTFDTLNVIVKLGSLNILYLNSPPFIGVQDLIAWATLFRSAAFLLVFGFHLAGVGALIVVSAIIRAASFRWHAKKLMHAVGATSFAKDVNPIAIRQTKSAGYERVFKTLTVSCNCNRRT